MILKKFINYVLFLILLFLVISCKNKNNIELNIFAAASLTDVIKEISLKFEKKYKVKVNLNFASSGTLANQIRHTNFADIFFSANEKHVKELSSEGFVKYKENILSNDLVIVSKANKEISYNTIEELLLSENINKIAIGNPESRVPVGIYAKQVLDSLGLFDKIKNKLIYCESVRDVLFQVERENVDIGFMYRTDFLIAKNCKILNFSLDKYHKKIVYPIAILKNNNDKDKIKQNFLNYLKLENTKKIFNQYGFRTLY